jgi:hypothetical protein
LSPVEAGAEYIDNDNYAMEFNRKLFVNGARPALGPKSRPLRLSERGPPSRETVCCFWRNVIKTLKQLTIEVMKST